VSAHSVWAVGSAATGKPLIEHWDGRAWNQVPSASPPGAQESLLNSVAATGSSTAWAVGYYNTGKKIKKTGAQRNGSNPLADGRLPLPEALPLKLSHPSQSQGSGPFGCSVSASWATVRRCCPASSKAPRASRRTPRLGPAPLVIMLLIDRFPDSHAGCGEWSTHPATGTQVVPSAGLRG
jgi:hypothetical protein